MDKLSSKHLFFVICGLDIVSLKTYPTLLFKTDGTDTWIAMIVASILTLLISYYIFNTCKSKNQFEIREIYTNSLGHILGGFFLFLFILTLYLTLIESCSVEANALHTNLLYGTPTWFFIIFIIFPAIYSLRKGKIAIIMVTTIGIILIMIAGINLGILTARYKNFNYLFPILQNGINMNFINVLCKILGLYSFVLIALPFAKDVENRKHLNKVVIISMLIVIQMEIVSTIGILSTFGSIRASVISYPKLIQTQQVSYFGFLESGELFVMLQIVGGWYIKYVLTFYSLLQILKEMNKLTKYSPFVISFLVAVPSMFISRNIFNLFKLLNYFTYICLINLVIIPILMFTIYNLKHISKNLKEN